jgi:integrase
VARVEALERKLGRVIPELLPHLSGRHAGHPVADLRKTWGRACRKAGRPGILFHDLRRSAVRGLVAAGVSERVAMTITGHKTRSVFDRYNIVSEADLQQAAQKLAARG